MRVGVLAVDPSSPFTGGALLGDRVRMQEHATDPGVFIRSMASRGHLGGLAWATPQALRVLDAAGCEVILVETVGVGQAEVDIAGLADTTVVLLAPGMGDGVQAAKAGVMEIGDVFVVNKADREGAAGHDPGGARHGRARAAPAGARRSWRRWRAAGRAAPTCSRRSTSTAPTWRSPASSARRRRARARDEIEAIAVASLRSASPGCTAPPPRRAGRAVAGDRPYTAAAGRSRLWPRAGPGAGHERRAGPALHVRRAPRRPDGGGGGGTADQAACWARARLCPLLADGRGRTAPAAYEPP